MAAGVLHSVLGGIATAEMGWIHPHEHLLISMREPRGETIGRYLHTSVLPKLRAAGVTESQIGQIMHDNPVEMLSRR